MGCSTAGSPNAPPVRCRPKVAATKEQRRFSPSVPATRQAAAQRTWRHAADQFRPRWPKLAAFLDASEHDVLAYMGFPAQHRAKLHSTNTVERLNKEVKRRADVVGISPDESAILRLIGAVLLEADDEWATQHRYMQVEAMAELLGPPQIEGEAAPSDDTEITPKAA